jgi:hypothetical protein
MRASRRTLRRALGLAVLAGALFAGGAVALAELDNQLFTSKAHRIKLTVPKGWRPSELPSYPGIALWMLRSQPEGRIVVGAEPLRQELFCSWPQKCRELQHPMAVRYACALRERLESQGFLVGPDQSGPKENLDAKLQSVWFDFTDGKRYVRQAIAGNERRVVSIALSTGSASDRATHVRAFEQALRSLRELSEAEARTTPDDPAPAPAASSSSSSSSTPPPPEPVTPPPAPGTTTTSSSTAGPSTVEQPAGATQLALPLFDPAKKCPTAPPAR